MTLWWLVAVWVVLLACMCLGATGWFRYLQARPPLWTEWEVSLYDHDVEVRWSDRGDMESRLRKPEVSADRRQARL